MPIWQVKVLNRKHQRRKKKGVRDMYSPERLGSRPGRWGFCAGGHWSATRSSAALAPAPQQRPAPCLVAPAFLGPSLLFPSLFSLRGPFFFLPRGLSLSPWTHPEDGEGREALLLAVKISRRGAFYRGEWTKDAASRQAEKNLCNSRVNSAAPRRLQQFINIVLHSSTLYIRRVKFKYK